MPQHAYRWRVATARLRRARGDLDGALALLDQAVPRYATDFSPPVRPVEALRARVQLARGDLDAAGAWAAAVGLGVDDDLSYVREFEHLTLARVLLARHAAGQAGELLERAGESLLDCSIARRRVGGPAARSRSSSCSPCPTRRGDGAAARSALDDALRRAEPEGHVRVFLDEREIAELLRSLASERTAPPHARTVAAAAAGPRPTPRRLQSGRAGRSSTS